MTFFTAENAESAEGDEMRIEEQRRTQLIAEIRKRFEDDLELELSAFRAETVLEIFLDVLGPQIYNEGVQDAQAYLRSRLDELDTDVYWRVEK